MKPINNIDAFAIGYSYGLDPMQSIVSLVKENMNVNFSSMIEGFESGRNQYLKWNGTLAPVHSIVVNHSVLEEVLLLGAIGLPLERSKFTSHQIKVVGKWYDRGRAQHVPDNDLTLCAILYQRGISLSK